MVIEPRITPSWMLEPATGIPYYWRVETVGEQPVVHTYALDEATHSYRDTAIFNGCGENPARVPRRTRPHRGLIQPRENRLRSGGREARLRP